MKLKYEFSVQEVADMFVAIAKNRETRTVESVFHLNETSALILKALQMGHDVPAIVEQILSQYDIEPQDAAEEVNAFIHLLKENGMDNK